VSGSPPSQHFGESRDGNPYHPSSRTCSGIHRPAKATARAFAAPWMPEHVRLDGVSFARTIVSAPVDRSLAGMVNG
jgi:hypothetical protein